MTVKIKIGKMKNFKIEIEEHENQYGTFFRIREKHYAFGFLRVVNELHDKNYTTYEAAADVADRYRRRCTQSLSKKTFIRKVTEIIG